MKRTHVAALFHWCVSKLSRFWRWGVRINKSLAPFTTSLAIIATLAAIWSVRETRRARQLESELFETQTGREIVLLCKEERSKELWSHQDRVFSTEAGDKAIPTINLAAAEEASGEKDVTASFTFTYVPPGRIKRNVDGAICSLTNFGSLPIIDVRGISKVRFSRSEDGDKVEKSGDIFFAIPAIGPNASFRFEVLNTTSMYATWSVPKVVAIRANVRSKISVDVPVVFFEDLLPVGTGWFDPHKNSPSLAEEMSFDPVGSGE